MGHHAQRLPIPNCSSSFALIAGTGPELAPVSLDTTLFNGTEKERGS